MISEIYLVSPRDVRKNRSDAVAMMLMSHAFSQLDGVVVTLLTPRVKRQEYFIEEERIYSLYGLDKCFRIIELPTKLYERPGFSTGALKTAFSKFFRHLHYIFKEISRFQGNNVLVYGRCFISTLPYIFTRALGLISSPVVFDCVYYNRKKRIHRFVLKNADIVVTGYGYLKEQLCKDLNVPRRKVIIRKPRFQVLQAFFDESKAKTQYRRELRLDPAQKYILYAGKTGKEIVEVQYFLSIVRKFPEHQFIIVGAHNEAGEYFSSLNLQNLTIFPFQPFGEFFKFCKAADILVAYYPDTPYNRFSLGPGKAGPYLMSGNPAIFSDLPSLREYLDEETVYFVPPDNTDLLSETVSEIIDHYASATKKAAKAVQYVKEHTFEKAAADLLNKIQRILDETERESH